MFRFFALALSLAFLSTAAHAQAVRVTIVGEVTLNQGGPGSVYEGVPVGSAVNITFLAQTPGIVASPGTLEDYIVINESIEVNFVGLPTIGSASAFNSIRVSNQTSGEDRISFLSGWAFDNGAGISGAIVLDETDFDSPDLENLAGTYGGDPDGLDGTGNSAAVFLGWTSVEIDPPLIGTPFCDPMDNNSTGLPTQLTGMFQTNIGSGLCLNAHQGPPGEFGYFLVGTNFADPGLPISQGRLCLSLAPGDMVGRYNVVGTPLASIGQFNAQGEFANLSNTSFQGFGFEVPNELPLDNNPIIATGETWHFQLWHREAGGQSNFSNGLSVTF